MGAKRKIGVLWEGIPEMMAIKEIRDKLLKRIYPCGKQTVFLENGKEISYEEFDKMYPLRLIYKEPHGQNICRKTDFIFK